MARRIIAIMAGGRGERFWPKSRLSRPKHLISIVGDRPMLAQTLDRLQGLAPAEDIFVITNAEQLAEARKACPHLPAANVVAEPLGRDTAAAVALANLLARRHDPEAVVALLPADHVVADTDGFRSTLRAAFEAAEAAEVLVTIAVRPTHPETGYGYLERGGEWQQLGAHTAYTVKRFVEKPDLERAKGYLAAGTFYWNGGMFVWRTAALEKALAAHAPEIAERFREMGRELDHGTPLADVLAASYARVPRISIDYAVMERAHNVVTIPALFDWDDVGSWPAVARHHTPDAAGNVLLGAACVEQGQGNIVISTDGHLTAVLGADHLVVVHTPDATLVCPADKAQEIKKLLKRFESHADWRRYL